jgi:CHAT domain-containing protein
MDAYELRMVSSTKDLLRQPPPAAKKTALLVGNPAFDLSEVEQRAALAKLTKPERSESRPEPIVVASSGGTHLPRGQCPDKLEPLDETQKEVKDIAKLLKEQGWEVSEHTWEEALAESVKGVKGPRVLHLATHGCFEPDQRRDPEEGRLGLQKHEEARGLEDPMLRSMLYFAGANRTLAHQPTPEGLHNGVLTAYEASTLTLEGTELVVLSAYETGLGKTQNGEGVFGLQRGLQEAGAQAVLMSEWSVPSEETQELMERFYQKWLGGKSKHEALSKAQQEMRDQVKKKYRGDFPWFWGAFVLVGR